LKSQKIILLLGGNQGNTTETIKKAIVIIQKKIGEVVCISNTYETAAWGPIPQNNFINIGVYIKSVFTPKLVLNKILEIETQLGRIRHEKYGPRTIDIDILFFGNLIINTPNLIVPHPQLPNRKFALQPCVDIKPALIHPILNKSVKTLLIQCSDTLIVTKL